MLDCCNSAIVDSNLLKFLHYHARMTHTVNINSLRDAISWKDSQMICGCLSRNKPTSHTANWPIIPLVAAVHFWTHCVFAFSLPVAKIIRERDIIGQQLLRRNDERTLLCEKIKILHAMLTKGNLQYNQRLGDIHLLKLEIKGLQREISIMNKDLPDAKALR